jgi:hypothetical protein
MMARKRKPKLRPKRAWVPVAPPGVVLWHLAARTRRECRQRYWNHLHLSCMHPLVRCRVEE